MIATSAASSGIVGLEVGQRAERHGDGDEDQQELLFLHRQARLLDAGLQIDALALRALVELGEVLLDLLLLDSFDRRRRRARVVLVRVLAMAWRR